MERFVALDLELTPFSGDQQRIIEIAAVRFNGGREADSFTTLVDPRCGLTHRVEVLTGICQQEVDAAPNLKDVIPHLVAFVGSDPIVGQSIDLDIECLASAGVHLSNGALDTFELASLLLPGLPAYDLGTIARALGVELEQEHRALGDAPVAGRVFLSLLTRASQLSLEVLVRINTLAAHLPDWAPAELFREIERHRIRNHFLLGRTVTAEEVTVQGRDAWISISGDEPTLFTAPQPTAPPPPLAPHPDEPQLTDPEELKSLLRRGGALASGLFGYEERAEQLQMVEAVMEALNSSEHLLVEAGTGTGKSMAYLLPAIFRAVRGGRRVVISTNTLNLQDQLFLKDIPALQQCLPVHFHVALLKGRSNYLCLRRWLVLARSPHLLPAEALLLIKTLIWLSITATGDRAELNLSQSESALWPRISAQAESCALANCPQFRRGSCFVTRARRNAESAHLIVVNHALLLSDLAAGGGILPEYSAVVVDEAHHLEEEATRQLGFTLSWRDLYSFLASLSQVGMEGKTLGFLPELAGAFRRTAISSTSCSILKTQAVAAQRAVLSASEEGKSFFEALHCFLCDNAEDRVRASARLRVTPTVRTQPGWSEIEVRWSVLSQQLETLRQLLARIENAIEALDTGQLVDQSGTLAELVGFQSYLERLCAQGSEFVSLPSPNGIYWVSGAATLEELAISSAPLHVGETLNTALFSAKDSVVLTSATLTTEGSFDYIRERLGLEDARELVLGSPFDYERSTLLYVVRDIPEPTKSGSQRAVESAITDLALTLEGRTMVLFTSHAQLRLTSNAIRPRLEEQGILLLAHGVDGSRRRLLQAFMSTPRAVLMGTSSFWEGIDVVGETLSCLVIVKLPFSVPTDPIFAARSEGFEEPFRQYSVPQTILRLKQGFGRLIRSRTDRGVVVLLDSRVENKFYGPAFIHSLPRCTLRTGPAAHVSEAAKDWLEK